MVTPEEAQQQLAQQEQQLTEARKQIEAYPTRIKQTKSQLYAATPQSQFNVRQTERQMAAEKARASSELALQEAQFRSEAERVRGEIEAYKKEQAAYEREAITKRQAYQKAYGLPTEEWAKYIEIPTPEYKEIKGIGTITTTAPGKYDYTGLTPEQIKDVSAGQLEAPATIDIRALANIGTDIQGFGGTWLTPTQIVKKEFLEKIGAIPTTPTMGEYFVGTTPKGREILRQVAPPPEWKPIVEQKSYENVARLSPQPTTLQNISSNVISSIVSLSPIKTGMELIVRRPTTTEQRIQGAMGGSGIAMDFLFGESGKRFIGIGLPGRQPVITAQQIKEQVRKIPIPIPVFGITGSKTMWTKFPSKVIGEFIPTTPGEVAIAGGGTALGLVSPPIIRAGMGLGAGYFGYKGATNVKLTPEQRVAAGIVGGLGIAGAGLELYPYIKGAYVSMKPQTLKIETELYKGKEVQFFRATIEGKEEKIYLIPRGNVPKTKGGPAFIRGAYGFTPEEQAVYIGKDVRALTSARGFVKKIGQIEPIQPGEEGYGLFFTPEALPKGELQTRVTRFGGGKLFSFPETPSQITFAPNRPQIIITGPSKVTKAGGLGTFKAMGRTSSELEVTALGGLLPTSKVGQTVIEGQAIDIYTGQLVKGLGSTVTKITKIQSIPIRFVSPTILTPSTPIISKYISSTIKTSAPSIISKPSIISIKPSLPVKPSVPISPPTKPSLPPTISTKSSISIKPPISISPPAKVSIKPPITIKPSPPPKVPTRPGVTTPTIIKKYSSQDITKLKAKAVQLKQAYEVLIRKKGKFIPTGKELLPLGKALKFGVTKTKAGVAQTFKLVPKGQVKLLEDISYVVPKNLYTTPKTLPKALLQFTERRGKTLTMKPEVSELHLFKRASKQRVRLF